MLSSIHPLGERARNNRWGVTVASFVAAAVLAGAVVGGGLGVLGTRLFDFSASLGLAVIGATALAAGGLDLSGVRPPGPKRQVNEHWIGHYRGWVYGGAFGAQLGTGVTTFVVTWTVYAALIAELLIGSLVGGMVIGAVFGLGRSLLLVTDGLIDTPSRLSLFHRVLARVGPHVTRATSIAVGGAAMVTAVGGLL